MSKNASFIALVWLAISGIGIISQGITNKQKLKKYVIILSKWGRFLSPPHSFNY
jgi:hypothetical protein